MEFWLTDHGRGLSALSIRTEDEGLPITPVINVMTGLRGKNVTNVGTFDDEDLLSLYQELEEHLLKSGKLSNG